MWLEPRVDIQQRQCARVTLDHLRRGKLRRLLNDQTPVSFVASRAPHRFAHFSTTPVCVCSPIAPLDGS